MRGAALVRAPAPSASGGADTVLKASFTRPAR